jgi:SAM-dependent methyltransferase
MNSLATLVVFLGAFLLFAVEPLIGKFILPWFGGSPAVWTACMLFFQATLLAGYAYAHLATRHLAPTRQRGLHLLLLAASLAFLPITPDPGWKPQAGADPTLRILALLGATLGLPFLLLAATGPLVQSWMSAREPHGSPYGLYAVSNAASLLALLSYPSLVEPTLAVGRQALSWSAAFLLFAAAFATLVWRSGGCGALSPLGAGAVPHPRDPYALWAGLSACGSVLLLAITNELTLDVAPMPLLWVLPLAIYLLTFVLCFARDHWYQRRWYLRGMALAVAAMAWASASDPRLGLPLEISIYSASLFVCCMICHGELVALRPPAERLTAFYLSISAGGAAGGLFVAALAPRFFPDLFELPIALTGAALLSLVAASRGPGARRSRGPSPTAVAAALAAVLGLALYVQARRLERDYRLLARNFYGTVKVKDERGEGDPAGARRVLIHGSILHGVELVGGNRRRAATAYYGPHTGIGIALREWRPSPRRRIGVIGLGAGTLATYGRSGDSFRFYEINPLVAEIARRDFSFLADSPARVELVVEDARLALEREAGQQFDLLAVDAFSSDSVPSHLLTLEAFELYFRHLKPAGVLAFHVSNRYLDLASLVGATARATGRRWLWVRTAEEPRGAVFAAEWAFVTNDREFLATPELGRAATEPDPSWQAVTPWTDASSSVFRILR